MAWFRVRLTEEEQRVVNEERCRHPNLRIREKMLVLWSLHTGLTRQHAAKAVGVSRATVQRYVAAFRQGGLDGLRQWNLSRPVSQMAAYRELILRSLFQKQPATTIAEACERIFQLTGLHRGPSQDPLVPQGSGPEVLPGPCDPRAAKTNLGRARCRPSRFSRDQTEAGPGRRPSR